MNKRKGLFRPGVIMFIGVFIFFVFMFADQQKLLNARNMELERLENKISEETMLNEKLKEDIELLGSDEYIEKIAREKLGYIKEGEKIFIDVNR
jgi:cell division protein FtsB